MAITTFSFALFTSLALAVYTLLPRRAQNYWLLACSYGFHVTWGAPFALVLLISTLVNYWVGRHVRRENRPRRGMLWLGIGFNLAVLTIFRLSGFYLADLNAFLQQIGLQTGGPALEILLPVGLSFYTLQNISYLLDVSRGQMPASRDLVDFSLYLAYFPKLLAGPIERAQTFLPRLAAARRVDNLALSRSLTLIVTGLFRKVVVADTLAAAIPRDVFTAPGTFFAPELWIWLAVYGLMIYNDFAGYTNMARGVSGLFGIELAVNFNYPYFARNFSEFWNRWHASLSHWLRDYIYYPLSRSLLRKIRVRDHVVNLVVPPMATMLVSGLWHGFKPNMLAWGGLYGLYLTMERVIALRRSPGAGEPRPVWRQGLGAVILFGLVLVAWVPFRAELPAALQYWQGLVNFQGLDFKYNRALLMIPLLGLLAGLDWYQYRRQGELTVLGWPRWLQAALLGGVLFAVILLSQTQTVEPFVYQGF